MTLLNDRYLKVFGEEQLKYLEWAAKTTLPNDISVQLAEKALNMDSVVHTAKQHSNTGLGLPLVFNKALEAAKKLKQDYELPEAIETVKDLERDKLLGIQLERCVNKEMCWLSKKEVVNALDEMTNYTQSYNKAKETFLKEGFSENMEHYLFDTSIHVLKKTFEDFYVKPYDVPDVFMDPQKKLIELAERATMTEENKYNKFIGALKKNIDFAMKYISRPGQLREIREIGDYDREFSNTKLR